MRMSRSMEETENERVGDGIPGERRPQKPWEVQPDSLPVESVAVALLNPADSPRLVGESVDHVRMLAESGAALPPILVHRSTMRVVDGMHRLRATVLRGERRIAVRFLDGYEPDVFIVAVRANTTHGLPLTRADRNAAANRIIHSDPQWSDRMIADHAGLSPKTVGGIRRRLGDELPAAPVRIGHDGRSRPVDSTEARAVTGEFIRTHPDATLRQITDAGGVSPASARDVQRRIERGEHAAPAPVPAVPATAPPTATEVAAELLPILKRDPAVRFTDHGRLLLRLLDAAILGPDQWDRLIENVPPHCVEMVASVARTCGEVWLHVAQEVGNRSLPQ